VRTYRENELEVIKESREYLKEYHEETDEPIDKMMAFIDYQEGLYYKQQEDYEKAYEIVKEVEEKRVRGDFEGELPVGWGGSDRTRKTLMCHLGMIEERREEIFETFRKHGGDDPSEWPEQIRETYENPCAGWLE